MTETINYGVRHIVCEEVTKPLPVYTHATVHNGIIYVSGVQGFIPGTFDFPSEDPGEQARQVLKNMRAILKSAGSDLDHVLKITMFMVNTEDFPKINESINEAFPSNSPARSSIAVAELPRHAKCVIECIAAVATPA